MSKFRFVSLLKRKKKRKKGKKNNEKKFILTERNDESHVKSPVQRDTSLITKNFHRKKSSSSLGRAKYKTETSSRQKIFSIYNVGQNRYYNYEIKVVRK